MSERRQAIMQRVSRNSGNRPFLVVALVIGIGVAVVAGLAAFGSRPGRAVAIQHPAASISRVDVSQRPSLQSSSPADQELADRYAPIVYLRQINNELCNRENEGFDPLPADFVLGRDEIPLMTSVNGRVTGRREIVAEAPVASDLYGLEQPDYLDFPGSPVQPGCTYRRYEADRLANEDIPNVAYAHIYQEPGTDELVLQYWMFYYFNDWINQHEGDWEMIMLFFDADTVEEALQQEPTRVVYAQHGGGERSDWDDEKLSTEDGHPVVYSALGAHASMYGQHVYLGLAENGTGFGCETTKGPHRRRALEAIVVPHEPSGPDDPFAWLGFDGRWGEFRRSEWNGPTGPNDKTSWTQPVTWSEGVRDTMLIVPEFEGFGQAPVDIFCGIVNQGSRLLVAFTRTPAIVGGILVLVAVLAAWVMFYTVGTVRQAYGYYRQHLKLIALIGAMLLPTGYLVATLQTLLFRVPPIEPFLSMMDRFPGIRVVLILILGSVEAAIAIIFVTPTVIWAMSQIQAGRTPGVIEAYRNGLRWIIPIFLARIRVVVRALLWALTIVGIPRAILILIRGSYIAQAVVHERDTPKDAIDDSAGAASGGMLRTVIVQVVLAIIVLLTGPIIAIFVLLAIPSRPLGLINFISSMIFAFLYPLSVVGMTLLYFELRAGTGDLFAGSADSRIDAPGAELG